MMHDILIDTDIGVDCDDAIALAAAIALERAGRVRIAGISVCTARAGAPSAVAAIMNHYGHAVDVSRYGGGQLACDGTDNYSSALMERYGAVEGSEPSVRYLRRKLCEAREKLVLVTIGPLTNIAALLMSEADDLSPLDGVRLVAEKVRCVYSMIGNFEHINIGEEQGLPEWNVMQDIAACRCFVERCPVEIVFSPYETGYAVLSGDAFTKDDPVGYAVECFFQKNPWEFSGRNVRCSWDPITVCEAAGEGLFARSACGTVTVERDGVTNFTADGGKHSYLIRKESAEQTAKRLEAIYALLHAAP